MSRDSKGWPSWVIADYFVSLIWLTYIRTLNNLVSHLLIWSLNWPCWWNGSCSLPGNKRKGLFTGPNDTSTSISTAWIRWVAVLFWWPSTTRTCRWWNCWSSWASRPRTPCCTPSIRSSSKPLSCCSNTKNWSTKTARNTFVLFLVALL